MKRDDELLDLVRLLREPDEDARWCDRATAKVTMLLAEEVRALRARVEALESTAGKDPQKENGQ